MSVTSSSETEDILSHPDIPSGIAAHFLNRTFVTAHVQLKLQTSRDIALEDASALYVSSPSAPDKLCWLKAGDDHRLVNVDKIDLDSIDSAAHLPDAMLSAIVYFSHADFCFLPEKTGRRPTRSGPLLSDVVMTATGIAPTKPNLVNDFKKLVTNLELLMARAPTTAPTKTGVVVPYYWDKRIQFRHVPFIPAETAVLSLSTPPQRGPSNKRRRTLDLFDQLEDLIQGAYVRGHLKSMRLTHTAQNLHVIDHHGNSVLPADWDRYLQNATACVHFTMRNLSSPSVPPSNDVFVANIHKIRIIMPSQTSSWR